MKLYKLDIYISIVASCAGIVLHPSHRVESFRLVEHGVMPNVCKLALHQRAIPLWVPRGCGTSRGQTRLCEDANTSRNVAASVATTRRRRPNSQRRSVAASQRQTRQGQTQLREDANTSRNVAASDATTRRRCPNSQRRSVAASQRQTRQRQMQLREDANTSRNVAASDDTTRRRSNIGSDPSWIKVDHRLRHGLNLAVVSVTLCWKHFRKRHQGFANHPVSKLKAWTPPSLANTQTTSATGNCVWFPGDSDSALS